MDNGNLFSFSAGSRRFRETQAMKKKLRSIFFPLQKSGGLEAVTDEVHNVVIRKPGTSGYEEAPAVVLQSHSDMVYIKSDDSSHDYQSPLKVVEKRRIFKRGRYITGRRQRNRHGNDSGDSGQCGFISSAAGSIVYDR